MPHVTTISEMRTVEWEKIRFLRDYRVALVLTFADLWKGTLRPPAPAFSQATDSILEISMISLSGLDKCEEHAQSLTALFHDPLNTPLRPLECYRELHQL